MGCGIEVVCRFLLFSLIFLASCKKGSNGSDQAASSSAKENSINTQISLLGSKDLTTISSGAGSTVGSHPTDAATWSAWASDNVGDNLSYNPAVSAKNNFNKTYSDLTITSPDAKLSVTTSVALAGAIASVKFNNEELIHATHGAAFQYHIRYSDLGIKYKSTDQAILTECDNPTEAGNMDNDYGVPSYLGESSSVLQSFSTTNENGIQGLSTYNIPTDFIAPQKYSTADYGSGHCFNNKQSWHTGFTIQKWVKAGWDSPVTDKRYSNVIQLKAQMTVPENYSKKLVQLELIAYLKRWAWHEWEYSAVPNKIINSPKAVTTGGGDDGYAKIFSNQDKSFAFGMISFHKKNEESIANPAYNDNTSDIFVSYEQQPVMYTDRSAAEPYHFRIIQSDWHFNYPKPNAPKTAYTYVAVGTLQEVKEALQDIYQSALQNSELQTKDNTSKLTVKLEKVSGDVTGAITNHYLDKNSGNYVVEGWACQMNRHESITVDPYFGGNAFDKGVRMNAPFIANQSMNDLASSVCQTKGIKHGFSFQIGKETLPWLADKDIYLHGVSNIKGAYNWALANPFHMPAWGLGGYLNKFSIDHNSGNLVVEGWACLSGYKGSIDIHIYAGASYFGAVKADRWDTHSGSENICHTSGVPHGFRFEIPKEGVAVSKYVPIYIFAYHPIEGLRNLNTRIQNDGHGIPDQYVRLNRYYSPQWNVHLAHLGNATNSDHYGYNYEWSLGWISRTQLAGTVPLYVCWIGAWNGAHMLTTSSNCEGQNATATHLGYIWSGNAPNSARNPVNRCLYWGNNYKDFLYTSSESGNCDASGYGSKSFIGNTFSN